MATGLSFETLRACTDTAARAGRLRTRRGVIDTPVFMPVGTLGSIKALGPDEVAGLGASILLANTYHLAIRPGIEVLQALGGLHQMMAWPGSILTDSGGFQILSLAGLRKVTEQGVAFQNHLDGARLELTPEHAMEIQAAIGSDIAMCLDHLEPASAPRAVIEAAMDRTTRWAMRCLAARQPPQALFAILQGGVDPELRLRHVEQLCGAPFDGFAVGGLSVGESIERMYETLALVAPRLPAGKPRYLMGVGRPIDLLEGVARGIDLFDCVMPTRNARKGGIFIDGGRRTINLKNARFKRQRGPLDDACACPTCARFGAGYLRHLLLAREVLALRLLSVHNLHIYLDLMRTIRGHLAAGTFGAFRGAWLAASP